MNGLADWLAGKSWREPTSARDKTLSAAAETDKALQLGGRVNLALAGWLVFSLSENEAALDDNSYLGPTCFSWAGYLGALGWLQEAGGRQY